MNGWRMAIERMGNVRMATEKFWMDAINVRMPLEKF